MTAEIVVRAPACRRRDRAGLDDKQTGTILGLKPEGVKGMRKRLRMAPDLKPGQKLDKVIGEVKVE